MCHEVMQDSGVVTIKFYTHMYYVHTYIPIETWSTCFTLQCQVHHSLRLTPSFLPRLQMRRLLPEMGVAMSVVVVMSRVRCHGSKEVGQPRRGVVSCSCQLFVKKELEIETRENDIFI